MQSLKNNEPKNNKLMSIFCYFGLHYYKTKEYSMTTFVVKEYCECKNCGKQKVFIRENDLI